MSYPLIVAALKAALEAVSGVKYTLDYEPKAIHDAPMLYLLLDGVERDDQGNAGVKTIYDIAATLVIRWQDNEQAERQLIAMLDGIMGALDTDPTLGGMNGWAGIVSAEAGYMDVSGTKYRIVVFGITAEERVC